MQDSPAKQLTLITLLIVTLLLSVTCSKHKQITTKISTPISTSVLTPVLTSTSLPNEPITKKIPENQKAISSPKPITAETILERMKEAENTRNSFSASVFLQQTNAALQISDLPRLGKLYYCSHPTCDLQFRLDLSNPSATTIIKDAKVKTYESSLQTVVTTNLNRIKHNTELDLFFFLFFSTDIRSKYNTTYLQEEIIEGEPAVLLYLTPYETGAYKNIKLWISTRFYLPIQQKITTIHNDIIEVKLSNIQTNVFIYNNELIDKLNSPNIKHILK